MTVIEDEEAMMGVEETVTARAVLQGTRLIVADEIIHPNRHLTEEGAVIGVSDRSPRTAAHQDELILSGQGHDLAHRPLTIDEHFLGD